MIVITRRQILRLKCSKFNFGWGAASEPAGRAYSAPPDPVAGFKGPAYKGRQGTGWEEERGRGEEKGDLRQSFRGINALAADPLKVFRTKVILFIFSLVFIVSFYRGG